MRRWWWDFPRPDRFNRQPPLHKRWNKLFFGPLNQSGKEILRRRAGLARERLGFLFAERISGL